MDDGPVREFDCVDCGDHVYSFGVVAANDEDVCAQCRWLRTVPAAAQAMLRKFLRHGREFMTMEGTDERASERRRAGDDEG